MIKHFQTNVSIRNRYFFESTAILLQVNTCIFTTVNIQFRRSNKLAIPKVFQSFNSLLGGITRKKNATIVGPSKQLVGEFPTITFERLYEYYHGWDQIKRAMDTIHQKFMGAGIEIKSNNEAFNTFIKKWWDVANAEQKMGEFFYSVFITGNGIL